MARRLLSQSAGKRGQVRRIDGGQIVDTFLLSERRVAPESRGLLDERR